MKRHPLSECREQQHLQNVGSVATETTTASSNEEEEELIGDVESQSSDTDSQTDEVVSVSTNNEQIDADALWSKIKFLESVNYQLFELLDSYKKTVQNLLQASSSKDVVEPPSAEASTEAESYKDAIEPPSAEVSTAAEAASSSSSQTSTITTTIPEPEKDVETLESEISLLEARYSNLEKINDELLDVLVPVAPVVPDETAVQQRKETEAALNTAIQETRGMVVPNAVGENELLQYETDHVEPMDITMDEFGVTLEEAYSLLEEQGLEGAVRQILEDTKNIIVSGSESQPVVKAESSEELDASRNPETITEAGTTSSLKSVEALVAEDALHDDGPPNNERSQVVEHMEVNSDEDEDRKFEGGIQQIWSSQPEADENNVNEVLNQNSEAAVTPQTVTAQNTSTSMESDEGVAPQPDTLDTSGKTSRSNASNLVRHQEKKHKACSQKKTSKASKKKMRSTLKKNGSPKKDTGTSADGSVVVSSPMQLELHGANQDLLEILPNSSPLPTTTTTETQSEPEVVCNEEVDVNMNSAALESQADPSEIGSSQKMSTALESNHEGDLAQPEAVKTSRTKEQFNCSVCDRTYSNPQDLLRHQKTDHQGWYKRQSKAQKKTSKAPKEKKSGVIPVQTPAAASFPSSSSGFYCSKCNKRCATRMTLMQHEGKVHNIWSTRRQLKTEAPKEKLSALSVEIPSSSKSANCMPTNSKGKNTKEKKHRATDQK